MKIIQICGAHGVGKTTLVKNLLASRPFQRRTLGGKEYWKYESVVVIGKYNSNNCCGVDADKYTSAELIGMIDKVIAEEAPRVVLFEDAQFGSTYAFKKRLLDYSRRKGRYIIVNLIADPAVWCERICARSGNYSANYDTMMTKAKGVMRSTIRAKMSGATAFFYDTGINTQADTLNMIEAIIFG